MHAALPPLPLSSLSLHNSPSSRLPGLARLAATVSLKNPDLAQVAVPTMLQRLWAWLRPTLEANLPPAHVDRHRLDFTGALSSNHPIANSHSVAGMLEVNMKQTIRTSFQRNLETVLSSTWDRLIRDHNLPRTSYPDAKTAVEYLFRPACVWGASRQNPNRNLSFVISAANPVIWGPGPAPNMALREDTENAFAGLWALAEYVVAADHDGDVPNQALATLADIMGALPNPN